MRVAVQTSLGITVRGLIAGKVPDNERLIAGTRKEHVRAGYMLADCRDANPRKVAHILLERGRQGSDPAGVALKGASQNQLLGHDFCRVAEAVSGYWRTRV